MSSLLLVSGASGQLGQETIRHLLETVKVPPARIVAGSRNPDKLAALKQRGVQVRKLDFDDVASIASAANGVERAVLISTDALDGTDRRYRQHVAAIKGFTAAGVKHVVYTSFVGATPKSPCLITPDHIKTETAMAESSLPGYTILQNPSYFENLLGSMPYAIMSGAWPSACGQGKSAMMSRSDVGRATACVLAGNSASKKTVALSGLQALTIDETVAAVSKVAGKSISVLHVNDDDQVANLVKSGLPEGAARAYESLEAHQRLGFLAPVTDEYKKVTGVDPTKFSDWLVSNKSKFMPK